MTVVKTLNLAFPSTVYGPMGAKLPVNCMRIKQLPLEKLTVAELASEFSVFVNPKYQLARLQMYVWVSFMLFIFYSRDFVGET